MKQLIFLIISALALTKVNANVWTVDCSTLTTQRLDPIVYPNYSPAGHVHNIIGADTFSHNVTYADLMTSTCTTCNVPSDKSNYWVPQLYVHKKDGKFYYVPMEFHVYYKLINDRGQTDPVNNPSFGAIREFPPGFQMVAGSPKQTEKSDFVEHKCYGPMTNTYGFPSQPEQCYAIRGEITFPSCWDGENLGQEGNRGKGHVSYPVGGDWRAGPCPNTHPVRIPTLFFEAIFKIQDFFEAGDELVYSFNDKSGFGFHGDFVNGWEEGVVQEAIDYCATHYDGAETHCQIVKVFDNSNTCHWQGTDDENVYKGVLNELPPYNGPF